MGDGEIIIIKLGIMYDLEPIYFLCGTTLYLYK